MFIRHPHNQSPLSSSLHSSSLLYCCYYRCLTGTTTERTVQSHQQPPAQWSSTWTEREEQKHENVLNVLGLAGYMCTHRATGNNSNTRRGGTKEKESGERDWGFPSIWQHLPCSVAWIPVGDSINLVAAGWGPSDWGNWITGPGISVYEVRRTKTQETKGRRKTQHLKRWFLSSVNRSTDANSKCQLSNPILGEKNNLL